MSDPAGDDEGDVSDFDTRIAEIAAAAVAVRHPPAPPAHLDACQASAWATWQVILVSLEAQARSQERATEAYLAARLGIRL